MVPRAAHPPALFWERGGVGGRIITSRSRLLSGAKQAHGYSVAYTPLAPASLRVAFTPLQRACPSSMEVVAPHVPSMDRSGSTSVPKSLSSRKRRPTSSSGK